MKQQRTRLKSYFEEISKRLQSQAEVLTPVITHRGEMGDNDHLWFADLIREKLPQCIGVDTGFVVNYQSDDEEDHKKALGDQSDILLVDWQHNAPLCHEKSFRVFPVEMVLGAIEITRNLTAKKLKLDLAKLSKVRALAGKKRYLKNHQPTADWRRPMAYMVGLKSRISLAEIRRQVRDIHDSVRPNAVLLLDKGKLYIRKPGTVEFTEYYEHALFQFLAMLTTQITNFPRGTVDLSKYVPSASKFLQDTSAETKPGKN